MLAALAVAGPAAAGAKDAAAKKLQSDAINTDYLATAFDKATSKLQQAIKLCGAKDCDTKVLAQIYRDLAMVQVAAKKPEAKASLQKALELDPALELDKDLSPDELKALFDGLKKGGGKAPEKTPEKAPEKTPPVSGEDGDGGDVPSEGDLKHDPVLQQRVNTPLPLYVEIPKDTAVSTVVVHFKPKGGGWQQKNLEKVGKGYGIELPCKDFASVGETSYYIEALSSDGDVSAYLGTRQKPLHVAFKNAIDGEAPALPGKAAPAQCKETADCPPDFPGCNDPKDKPVAAPPKKSFVRSLTLNLGIQQDFTMIGAADGVCSGAPGYDCFYENPTDWYFDVPAEGDGLGNKVKGGFGASTTRALLGADLGMFHDSFSLGLRLGFAFAGGTPSVTLSEEAQGVGYTPGTFMPLHAEVRGTWQFLGSGAGLHPFLGLASGLAQMDTRVNVEVVTDVDTGAAVDYQPVKLAAYKRAGQAFFGLFGGVKYAIPLGKVPTSGSVSVSSAGSPDMPSDVPSDAPPPEPVPAKQPMMLVPALELRGQALFPTSAVAFSVGANVGLQLW